MNIKWIYVTYISVGALLTEPGGSLSVQDHHEPGDNPPLLYAAKTVYQVRRLPPNETRTHGKTTGGEVGLVTFFIFPPARIRARRRRRRVITQLRRASLAGRDFDSSEPEWNGTSRAPKHPRGRLNTIQQQKNTQKKKCDSLPETNAKVKLQPSMCSVCFSGELVTVLLVALLLATTTQRLCCCCC